MELLFNQVLVEQLCSTGVVAAQDDVVDLADVHQLGATGIADGGLHVLLHLDQRILQRALDGLQNALAFHVLVFTLVVVRRRPVVFLVQLSIHFHGLAGRLFVACKQRANHHHGGAKANAFGNVAVAADTAVGNDGLGGHARAPLQGRQLPAARAKTGLELGDAHLAGAYAHLGRVGAPGFQVNHGFGCGHVAGNHEGVRDLGLQVLDHVLHAVGMAMGDVDGDVFGADFLLHKLVDGGVVGRFDAQRDRGVQALRLHVLGELDVVDVKTVHHVEVTVLRQILADLLVQHGLHVGRHDRQSESAATQLYAGVALRATFHAALAGQQQDVVVVEDFHGSKLQKKVMVGVSPTCISKERRLAWSPVWLALTNLGQKKTGPQKLGPGD